MKLLSLSNKFEVLSNETSLYIKGGKKKKNDRGNNTGTTPPPVAYSDTGGFPPILP